MNIPKIPAKEILWETILDNSKPLFIVTSNGARDKYFLYDVSGDKPKKLGSAATPPLLKDKYIKKG